MLGPDEDQTPQPQVFLRRNDQFVLGAAAFCGLAVLACLWYLHGGPAGELIELEQMRRESLEFQTDINRADWPELSELPGIGETLAKRIVEHRATHGPFRRIDELRSVRGIGPKVLERIRPYLVPLDESPP